VRLPSVHGIQPGIAAIQKLIAGRSLRTEGQDRRTRCFGPETAESPQHPGQRGEQIAADLGADTATMRGPIKKLIADGKVRTTDQRRGMAYFAA